MTKVLSYFKQQDFVGNVYAGAGTLALVNNVWRKCVITILAIVLAGHAGVENSSTAAAEGAGTEFSELFVLLSEATQPRGGELPKANDKHTPVSDFEDCGTLPYAPLPTFNLMILGDPATFPTPGAYNFCAYMDTAFCSLEPLAGLAEEIEEFALVIQCVHADINGPLDPLEDPPFTGNGIPDGQYELGILAEVLNDTTQPLHNAATDAFQDNFQAIKDMIVLALSETTLKTDDKDLRGIISLLAPHLVSSMSAMLAGYATLGDAQTYAALDVLLEGLMDLGIEVPPGGIEGITTGIAALGPEGDADGDGFTNREEYVYFVDELAYSAPDYVAAALDPNQHPPMELHISPGDAFSASGYEGGPFTPASKDYLLSNNSGAPLDWSASASAAWIVLSSGHGTLPVDGEVTVTVTLDADTLSPDTYTGEITFTNDTADASQTRHVYLTVHEWHGDIEVTDTIPPADDHAMPFGNCAVGHNYTEQVTIHNTHGEYSLVVEAVSIGGAAAVMFGLSGITMPYTVDPEDSITFDVDYAPTGLGLHNAHLEIASNDVNNPIVTIALTGTGVTDTLEAIPADGFAAAGYEGGPFTPETKTYTLQNTGGDDLDWTAVASETWVTLSNNNGTLAPDAEMDVIVGLDADALAQGDHAAAVTFTNTNTSNQQVRDVNLTVLPIPGEIEVTDSILPIDDLYMPFGGVVLGKSRTENISVANVNPDHEIIVSDITIMSVAYFEDFSDGLAQDWEPDAPYLWSVHDERYCFSGAPYHTQSMYTGQTWQDCSVEVAIIGSASVFFRASSDFRWGNTGDAYWVYISHLGDWSVYVQYDGNYYEMDAGSFTPLGINQVNLAIEGGHLEFLINGVAVWSDWVDEYSSYIPGSGYIGFGAGGAAAYFDDVHVHGNSGSFRIESLPGLPTTVSPYDSFTFDVICEPISVAEHSAWVTITSNDIIAPTVEVTLTGEGLGRSFYVSTTGDDGNDGSSWAAAKATIQAALDGAVAGDEIWVAAGVYYPTSDHGLGGGDRFMHIRMRDGVALYGGFSGDETEREARDWKTNITRLSGDTGSPEGPCYHVIYNPSVDELTHPNTRLDGFVISDGSADGLSPSHTSSGGGLYSRDNIMTVANCVFENNTAAEFGGGAYIDAGAVTITNCTFVNNNVVGAQGIAAGGALVIGFGTHHVQHCRFIDNTAVQWHAFAAGAGAVFCGEGDITFQNCVFHGNMTDGMVGGGAMGIASETSTEVALVNCTFTGNEATYMSAQGGAIGIVSALGASPDVSVINSILYGNSPDELYYDVQAPVVSYSNVAGGVFPGTGNIDEDPLFVDAAAGDLRLQPVSPCINAGDPAGVPPAPVRDILGTMRPQDGRVDMGAYEHDDTPPTVELALVGPAQTGADVISFTATFSEFVAPTFTASAVALTGTLSGMVTVSGNDPDYTVTVTLDDPDADGTVGIEVLPDVVSDPAGNLCAGGVSPLCEVFNWRGLLEDVSDAVLLVGSDHSLSVTPDCDADPDAISYQWWRDTDAKTPEPGPTASTWALTDLNLADSGVYWCEMSYAGETYLSSAATIVVLGSFLTIHEHPVGADKLIGEDHSFTVTAVGNGPLHYQWRKDETVIHDAPNEDCYEIEALDLSDEGWYDVVVSDDYHTETSEAAYLSVSAGLSAGGLFTIGAGAALLVLLTARLTRKRAKAAAHCRPQ